MATVHRIYNFAAGPAVLPVTVLEEIQRDLLALPGVGMSILEISHRSKTFEAILEAAEADIRALADVPPNYRVLFLQGGASLQFSMVPMNLLDAGAVADYIDAGSWADKAITEARKVGRVNIAASTRAEHYTRIPDQRELTSTRNSSRAQFRRRIHWGLQLREERIDSSCKFSFRCNQEHGNEECNRRRDCGNTDQIGFVQSHSQVSIQIQIHNERSNRADNVGADSRPPWSTLRNKPVEQW